MCDAEVRMMVVAAGGHSWHNARDYNSTISSSSRSCSSSSWSSSSSSSSIMPKIIIPHSLHILKCSIGQSSNAGYNPRTFNIYQIALSDYLQFTVNLFKSKNETFFWGALNTFPSRESCQLLNLSTWTGALSQHYGWKLQECADLAVQAHSYFWAGQFMDLHCLFWSCYPRCPGDLAIEMPNWWL